MVDRTLRYGFICAISLNLMGCYSAAEPTHATQRTDQLLRDLAEPEGRVMVVAHRACWTKGAPENSIEAIEQCIEIGVDMIEIDVRLTADGVAVLFHDATLDRTTNGSGRIDEKTFAELSQLRLKPGAGGPSEQLTDARIPTLEEGLRKAQGRVLVNLDAKTDVFDEAFQIVRELGIADQILMKMRAAPSDLALRNAAFLGQTQFMPIIVECNEHTQSRYCATELKASLDDFQAFDPVAYELVYSTDEFVVEGLSSPVSAQRRIWINTLQPRHAAGKTDEGALTDPQAHWGHVIGLGANIIQTDYPARLIEYLEARNQR